MTFDEIISIYDAAVLKWLVKNNYTNVSEHVITIITNILMTKDGVLSNSGSFVTAVLNNDLEGVIRYGDTDCLANLKIIYQGYYNIDTYNLLPKNVRLDVDL